MDKTFHLSTKYLFCIRKICHTWSIPEIFRSMHPVLPSRSLVTSIYDCILTFMGALWLDLDWSSCFFITVIHSIFLGLSFTCQIYTLSVILILNKTPWNDFSHFFSNERRLVLPVDQLMMKWILKLRNPTNKIVNKKFKIEKNWDKKSRTTNKFLKVIYQVITQFCTAIKI